MLSIFGLAGFKPGLFLSDENLIRYVVTPENPGGLNQGKSCTSTLQKSCLQNQHILRRRFPDSGDRNAGIKSNKSSFMLNRKSK